MLEIQKKNDGDMAMNVNRLYFNYLTFLLVVSSSVKYRDGVFPTIKVRTHPRRDRKEGVSCDTMCLQMKYNQFLHLSTKGQNRKTSCELPTS